MNASIALLEQEAQSKANRLDCLEGQVTTYTERLDDIHREIEEHKSDIVAIDAAIKTLKATA